jgi:bisphosphoglycerate-independent phosphoglycerate mutase (AlkP superfamily)
MANESPIKELLKTLHSEAEKRIKTPSERIMMLSMERDKIFDRIKDAEKELEIVEKTAPDYVYIEEQLRYMKMYKDVLGKRIKALVDKT